MAGSFAPTGYPIRRVTDTNQTNGRVVNPVRDMKDSIGNLHAGNWPKTDAGRMKVEKPTRVGSVKRDYQSQEGV